MIQLTDEAKDRLKEMTLPTEAVRVAVRGGGCAGMSYSLEICGGSDEEDMLIEFDHVKIYVDPHSALLLAETTVDFVRMGFNEGFVFLNAAANTTCGCGMSFS
jgi:iron-sulfur cluster assembly protein